jgi:hypothetical protein
MDPTMRPEDLQELLRHRPFEPFRLHLTDGSVHEIRHPEMARAGRSILWIHSPETIHSIPFGQRRVGVALIHIVQIEFVKPESKPSAN